MARDIKYNIEAHGEVVAESGSVLWNERFLEIKGCNKELHQQVIKENKPKERAKLQARLKEMGIEKDAKDFEL